MATRSIIARTDGDGWTDGVYVHWDGSPSSRIPVLTDLVARADGDVASVLDVLTSAISGGGWSVINPCSQKEDGRSLDGRGEFVEGYGIRYLDNPGEVSFAWHGEDIDFAGAEYVYAIDPASGVCAVFEIGWRGETPEALTLLKTVDLRTVVPYGEYAYA